MEFKFRTPEDAQACEKLAEASNMKLEEWVKHRYKMLGQLDNFMPDFRKSQDMKRNWKLDRNRYMSSIARWQKSVAGKRFHRQLGKYLALRAPLYKESMVADPCCTSSEEYLSKMAQIALTSIHTHLLIESLYIEPDFESHANMREFLKMSEAMILSIQQKINLNENLDENDYAFLEDMKNG